MSRPRHCQGLGLLPLTTVLTSEKITRKVSGRLRVSTLFGQPMETTVFKGYEIHLGETRHKGGSTILAELRRDGVDGAFLDGAVSTTGFVWGTYVHGLFDDD